MAVKHAYRAALVLPNFLILTGSSALPDSHKLQLYKLAPCNGPCRGTISFCS